MVEGRVHRPQKGSPYGGRGIRKWSRNFGNTTSLSSRAAASPAGITRLPTPRPRPEPLANAGPMGWPSKGRYGSFGNRRSPRANHPTASGLTASGLFLSRCGCRRVLACCPTGTQSIVRPRRVLACGLRACGPCAAPPAFGLLAAVGRAW